MGTGWIVEPLAGLEAEMEYFYDEPVLEGALRMELEDAPWTVWHVRRGKVRAAQRVGDRQYEVEGSPGDWMCLPPFARRHEMDEGTHLWSIRFHLRAHDGLPVLEAGEPLVLHGAAADPLRRAGAELTRVIPRWLQPSSSRLRFDGARPDCSGDGGRHVALVGRAALMGWFAAYFPVVLARGWKWAGRSGEPGTLAPALAPLLKKLAGSEWSGDVDVNRLAREAGMSPTHLRRLFRSGVGCGPKEWLDRRRLERAVALMRAGDPALKAVAHELGFSSAPHFWNWFRARTGMTPTQWVQRHGRGGV